ncbi:MAG: tail fiber domain-containing protein [Cognatishimia sp.]
MINFKLCRNTVSAVSISALIAVTACAPFSSPSSGPSSNYCVGNRGTCVLAAVIIVAGVMLAQGVGMSHYYLSSDERLKTDIKKLEVLDNGITVYAFRYVGDDRYFAGVLAQDLLKDPRYAHAVKTGPKGYLMVNYGALPLKGMDMDVMKDAGDAALQRS